MNSHTQRRMIAAAGALLAAVSLSACRNEVAPVDNPPVMVRVERAEVKDHRPRARLSGEIRARLESDLAFRVPGEIIRRAVDVGDHVEAGQILAAIDPSEQEASRAAADAEVRASEAVLRQVKSTYERQQALLRRGFTTRRDHDQAVEALRTAEAALAGALAARAKAEDELAHTILRANVAGVVTERHAETGQVVQPAQPVYSIAEDGPRDAVFDVHEALLGGQPPEGQVHLSLVYDDEIGARGSVREIAPAVDPTTGTVQVKVGLGDVPAAMTLGAAVVGKVDLPPRRRIAVPWSAMASLRGQPAVWIVDERSGTVSLQAVEVDAYETGLVIVRSGIRPGDLVVTAGGQFLHPGHVVAFTEGEPR